MSFPDVPEALTCGDCRTEALEKAEDALAVALSFYVDGRRDIPVPSDVVAGQELVAIPSVVAAKLALYTAMRRQGVTQVDLGRRLDLVLLMLLTIDPACRAGPLPPCRQMPDR